MRYGWKYGPERIGSGHHRDSGEYSPYAGLRQPLSLTFNSVKLSQPHRIAWMQPLHTGRERFMKIQKNSNRLVPTSCYGRLGMYVYASNASILVKSSPQRQLVHDQRYSPDGALAFGCRLRADGLGASTFLRERKRKWNPKLNEADLNQMLHFVNRSSPTLKAAATEKKKLVKADLQPSWLRCADPHSL